MLVHTDGGQNTTIIVRWLANDEGKERTLENLSLQKKTSKTISSLGKTYERIRVG
jgi:hypothetical protein